MEQEFTLNWRIGVRTAFLIIETAKPYGVVLSVCCDGLKVDGNYVMGWLVLQAAAGKLIRLTLTGPQSPAAMEALTELFTVGERLDFCPFHDCPSTPILVGYTREWIHYGCSKWHAWNVPRYNLMRSLPPLPPLIGEAHA